MGVPRLLCAHGWQLVLAVGGGLRSPCGLLSCSGLAWLPQVQVSKDHSERQRAEAARFLVLWPLELAQNHFGLILLVRAVRKPAQIQEEGNGPFFWWKEL